MTSILEAWNVAEPDSAVAALNHCCASRRWAEGVMALRPFDNPNSLFIAADQVWATMAEPDWMEAFSAHPRIGERRATQASSAKTLVWGSCAKVSSSRSKSAGCSSLTTR